MVRSPSMNENIKGKKYSVSTIDARMKVGMKGNVTERNAGQRVNTQCDERRQCMVTDRVNTLYEGGRASEERDSPEFYKSLVADESSFLDF